ncbi:hypothetical protein AGABI1DRAFT_123674 [Agaricus bisporus var. burnettii JB137-S8]|uniref:Uncharacterized protein n=1 Tax=Agaricus bisporus var. burnettii (strain JB137-S8 / ATCC MYA-4627 / FGSC 10392) TaxID=597362 RepID=K5Y5F9_AGABU|nr:uncharacterized protein AGABI1DRAFT_123674 [Agaricus bisporus var. burnettii JB137-S8]EKM83340.1 hypothetical protein AGABI1DRAFT_123674 [Agaricus bisporus var. burnettii JB137-S8]
MTIDPSSSPPSFLPSPPSPSLLIALWAYIQDTFLGRDSWGSLGGFGGNFKVSEHLPSPLSFPIL